MSEDAEAPEPDDPAWSRHAPVTLLMSQHFTAATVTALRHTVEATIASAGLVGDAGFDFLLAVHELVTNAVRHGGGRGHLYLCRQEDVLICEITDQGKAADSLPIRLPGPDVSGGRGLWLAHQLTDQLVLVRRPDGVTATVTLCLEPLNASHIRSESAAPRTEGLSPKEEHQ
jgi:serine/threonine-protein kinase RsbW